MRKLSEIRGKDALRVLADLIAPISELVADDEIVGMIRKRNKLGAAEVALRMHPDAILTVLAIYEGVEPEGYNPSVLEIPGKVIQILNDPDIASVFMFAGPKTSSGSATETTTETEAR